jgi:hypothetical protein
MMKTVTLRTLVRDPRKVKRLTRGGATVEVTDNGKPLWLIQPIKDFDEAERLRVTDEALDEVLRGRVSAVSAVKILEESRR